jgi:hypothetical protein
MNYCVKGHRVPDENLTCPECASARREQGLHEIQAEFLRKVVGGAFGYTLRVAKLPEKHVLMYTSYTRTFCGRELKAKPQISYQPYDAEALARVCAGCRIEIQRALQEVE